MILAFDTATPATTVALWDPDGSLELEARDDPQPGARPNHATRLLPLIAELLQRSGAGWPDVRRIAVGIGPGTFTGLRIGIATARALARSTGCELVGVSTLQSLALNGRAAGEGEGIVTAVIDARRREVFAAAWPAQALDDRRAELLSAGPMAPAQLAGILSGQSRIGPEAVLALGDGAVEYRAILEPSGVSIPQDDSPLHRVAAINHCRLAPSLPAEAGEEVRPEYLRIPDAERTRPAAPR